MRFALLVGFTAIAVVGCKSPAEAPVASSSTQVASTSAHAHQMHGEAAPDFRPGETREFGAAPAVDAPSVPLAQLLGECLDTQKPCVVEAHVGASCTSSGCWSTLAADGISDIVFVEMKDEAFTFPKNAAGTTGTLSGVLTRTSFSAAEANYYRTQTARVMGGEAPARVGEEITGYLFTIDGARLTKAP